MMPSNSWSALRPLCIYFGNYIRLNRQTEHFTLSNIRDTVRFTVYKTYPDPGKVLKKVGISTFEKNSKSSMYRNIQNYIYTESYIYRNKKMRNLRET